VTIAFKSDFVADIGQLCNRVSYIENHRLQCARELEHVIVSFVGGCH
jgi:hypothetical protein